MKKLLLTNITLSCIFAGLLSLTFYAGQAKGKYFNRQERTTEQNNYSRLEPLGTLQVSQAPKVSKHPHAENAKGTLYGENAGDFIILQ